MSSNAEADLGPSGVAWLDEHPTAERRPTDRPADHIDYMEQFGFFVALAVQDMPLEVLKGMNTAKAWWLSVACNEPRIRLLVDRQKRSTKSLLLWDAAHNDAIDLLKRGPNVRDLVLLDRKWLHALNRVGPTKAIELIGATDEHIRHALTKDKLTSLRLRDPQVSPTEFLAHRPPKITIAAPTYAWRRGTLRVQPKMLAADPPTDKSVKILVVRGPGPVDVERLALWAQGVTELHLEDLEPFDVLAVVHKRLKKLRLFRCGITSPEVIEALTKAAPKLEALDLTGNNLPTISLPKMRVTQVDPARPLVPMPGDERFRRAASAPEADRTALLLDWGTRVADNLRHCLEFIPLAAGPAKKLGMARNEALWVNRFWRVEQAQVKLTLSPIDTPHTWYAFTRAAAHVYERCRLLLVGDWKAAGSTAEGLREIAEALAASEFLAHRWHPLLPPPEPPEGATPNKAYDAASVVAGLDELDATQEDPMPDPLPFGDRHGSFESDAVMATRWGMRAMTRVVLELPKAEAKALRDLREQAYLGDIAVFMGDTPPVLFNAGTPRAKALARAISMLSVELQNREVGALGRFAVRLRRFHGQASEAQAQTYDLRAQHQRPQWVELNDAVLAGRMTYLAERCTAPVDPTVARALSRGKLTAPTPIGNVDDAWSYQWTTWLGLFAHARKERSAVGIIAGRHMAEWVGHAELFASIPDGGERDAYFGLDQDRHDGVPLYDILPKRREWDIDEALLDSWAHQVVQVVQADTGNARLRSVLDTWNLGGGNRSALRWPSFRALTDPVVDPWLRALEAIDSLYQAQPTQRLEKARWGLANLCSGALNPDDSKGWYEEIAGAFVDLVPGRTAEEVQAQVIAAFTQVE